MWDNHTRRRKGLVTLGATASIRTGVGWVWLVRLNHTQFQNCVYKIEAYASCDLIPNRMYSCMAILLWLDETTNKKTQAAGGNNLISVVVVHDHLHKSFWWLWEEQVQFHPSPLSK